MGVEDFYRYMVTVPKRLCFENPLYGRRYLITTESVTLCSHVLWNSVNVERKVDR